VLLRASKIAFARLLLLLLALGVQALPARSQVPPPSGPLTILVVVPEGLALDALPVERWMDLLKIERHRQHLTPDQLPLLRLSMGRAQHRAVLEKLGLAPAERLRTFTCRRDAEGWPSEILTEHEPGTPADLVVAAVLKEAESPRPDVSASLGLLLVADPQAAPLTQPFLEELGRFWLQRYGRVRPSPYPLASYDVSRPETLEALRRVFPELVEGELPLVALCRFQEGQPVRVLQVFRGLDTPASLVRQVSAARGLALAGPESGAQPDRDASLPGADPLALSAEQERLLLVSRLNETGQQLWNEAKEDHSERNQGPKRILLRIIEDSRRHVAGEAGAYGELLESLRDYQVEPLVLQPGSSPSIQALRLLQLAKELLDSP
jgi:hypothetical protein